MRPAGDGRSLSIQADEWPSYSQAQRHPLESHKLHGSADAAKWGWEPQRAYFKSSCRQLYLLPRDFPGNRATHAIQCAIRGNGDSGRWLRAVVIQIVGMQIGVGPTALPWTQFEDVSE